MSFRVGSGQSLLTRVKVDETYSAYCAAEKPKDITLRLSTDVARSPSPVQGVLLNFLKVHKPRKRKGSHRPGEKGSNRRGNRIIILP